MNREDLEKLKNVGPVVSALREKIKSASLSDSYDEVLLAELEQEYNRQYEEYSSLLVMFNKSTSNEDKQLIVDKAQIIVNNLNYLDNAIYSEKAKATKAAKSTGAVVGSTVSTEKESKSNGFATAGKIAIGVAIAGLLLFGAEKCNIVDFSLANNNPTPSIGQTESVAETEEKVEELVTEEKDEFVDASNEEQIHEQAQIIYDQYINIESIPEATKNVLSVEVIENMLRMSNGEFALDNGEVDYIPGDATGICDISNDINTYYNATSFVQYGTNLEYKPCAVFFESGTLARTIAEKQDELMSKIYEDIRKNDIKAFQEDSVIWGEFVRDTFIYNDSTGEVISIWQVDPEQAYQLAKSITSPYGCSIMEYAIGVNLASRDGNADTFGNTFGICIPYCYDEHNELQYVPLSQLIYDINETPMNDLAARAGELDEWKENNDPIMVQLGLNNMSKLDAIYNNEYGQSRSLK